MGRHLTTCCKKDTLLSIDLDYWNRVTTESVEFLKKVVSLDVPIALTKHHHQVLPFVNKHKTKVLMNIDYHSDLCEDDEGGGLPALDCGSWVNHVRWRKSGEYVWVCPNKTNCYYDGAGRCDSERDRTTDPFKNRNTGWYDAKVLSTLKHVELERVNAAAISVSPDFLHWNFRTTSAFLQKERESYYVRLKSVLTPLPFKWLEDWEDENTRTFILN